MGVLELWQQWTNAWLAPVAAVLAVYIFLSGLDDLALDLAWFVRISRKKPAPPPPPRERRIAVFVPLWQEASVIERMLEHNLAAIRYANYEIFAGLTGEIKKATGIKGKELFHPLRVALTARASGLELDKFIPLVEEGSRLGFPRKIKGCLERLKEISAFLNL